MTVHSTRSPVVSAGSWSASLEQLATQDLVRPSLSGRKPLPFAPHNVPSHRAYDQLPVVMVVSTLATQEFQRPFYEALELIQQATAEFKVVVFTDDVARNGIRDFDWAVENCFAESDWRKLSSENWLEMASERLEWAQKAYGAACMLAPVTAEDVVPALETLRRLFSIPRTVVADAVTHFSTCRADAADGGEAVGVVHHDVRGWVHALPDGQSDVTLVREGTVQALHVDLCDGPGLLVAPSGSSWTAPARSAGWSTVEVGASAPEGSPTGTLEIARAFADALLDAQGTAVVVAPGGALDSASTFQSKVRAAVDPESGHLTTTFGSELTVQPMDLPAVLVKLDLARRAASALSA